MDPDGASLGSQTQVFGVQLKCSRMGRVQGYRPGCFGVQSKRSRMDGASSGLQTQAFCVLSPRAPVGHSRGRRELCALPHPRFLTTGGAEFCRLSRSLGLE